MGDCRAPVRCLLRFKRFRLSRIFHENGYQNGSQNKTKMEPWALLRQIFLIFGRHWRVLFFDAFFGRQKVGQKSQK